MHKFLSFVRGKQKINGGTRNEITAMEGDGPLGRLLSPLPPIHQTTDASAADGFLQNGSTVTEVSLGGANCEQEPKTSMMFEIGRRMIRLYLCEDHSCDICLEGLDYIASYDDYPESVTQRLLQLGLMELFQHILRQFFQTAIMEEGHKPSDACMSALRDACIIVSNITDDSSDACQRVILLELHVDVINCLKNGHLDPRQKKKGLSSDLCKLVDNLMTVLYNVVQVATEARELYREQGIVEVLQRFRTGTNKSVSCLALMFLAWVINEDENSILSSDEKAFSFLKKELKSSLDEESHRTNAGYKAVEILAAINKLAVTDANKEQIVKSGILSSYVAFLELTADAEEQFLAAQGIWTLAFKCAEEIKKEKSCVDGLEMLLKKSKHDEVRRQANGALIALGIKQESLSQASNDSSKEDVVLEAKEKRRRIFISYQHSSKETVFKIRDRLRDHGYAIWIDADEMSGSIAEDITDGIDNSSIVLACLSQKYYESPYCKKEVIYADENRKEIIPLTMEPRYKPHGWLSFRMSDKLRIDFSQPRSFDESLRVLLQRLKKGVDEVDSGRRNNQPEVTNTTSHVPTVVASVNGGGAICEPEVVQTVACSVSYSACSTAGVHSWTQGDVREWLERNNFRHLMKWFDDYDGRLLLEFQYVLEKCPELVAPSFIAAHSVRDFLRLIMALRTLP